uniref:Capsid protein alpha n=1 Tax=Lutzomyia nodavirus TaxID=1670671 RepID=A0A0H4LT83_9VIRU|nr:Capsid [Lutzomyia nodavirus]
MNQQLVPFRRKPKVIVREVEAVSTTRRTRNRRRRNRNRRRSLSAMSLQSGNDVGVIATTTNSLKTPLRSSIRRELDTHALTVREHQFIQRFLDPCGEQTTLTDNCKIPDGALPNSGLVGLRQNTVVVCPFQAETDGLLSNKMWTLMSLRVPFLKTAMILVAFNQQGDPSDAQLRSVITALNNLVKPVIHPEWIDVSDSVKLSFVQWRQLQILSDEVDFDNSLLSQFRICNWGVTCWHNAPDLVNQGMVMLGQWNLDTHNETRVIEHDVDGEQMVVAPLQIHVESVASGAVLNSTDVIATAMTPAGDILPLLYEASSPQAWRTQDFFVSPDAFDVRLPGGALTTIPAGDAIHWSLVYTPGTGGGSNTFSLHLRGPGKIDVAKYTRILPGNTSMTIMLPVEFHGLMVPTEAPDSYRITTPPLTTEDIIQSTSKAVYLTMKQDNGWYMVGRVFQPVFNLTEANTQRRIQWNLPGTPLSQVSIGGLVDTYDRNFSIGNAIMAGIPYAAAPSFKLISDIEVVANAESPWQTLMHANEEKSETALSVARTIMDAQPFGYPESYNSLGVLTGLIGNLLSSLPIVSNVMPVVKKVVDFFRQPVENGQVRNRLVNVAADEAREYLSGLLSRLQL